jgi:UDP-glucose 4-epimerase
MRILIIGGEGFIGKFLSKALIKNLFKVDILTREFFYDYSCKDKNVKPLNFIRRKKEELNLNDYHIIVYLAWGTKPSTAFHSPKKDLTDSLLPGLEWLDKISVLNPKPTFIFLSSGGAVYGESSRASKEEDELNPMNPYGIAKVSFEKYLQFYSYSYDFPVVILRPSNVYGPLNIDLKQGVIQNFIQSSAQNKLITIWGNGKVVRDYLFIDDFIELVVKVIAERSTILKDSNFRCFNVGSGVGYSVNEIADMVLSHFDHKIRINHIESTIVEPSFNVLDITRAKLELNWEPKFDINLGISKAVNYFKQKA